MSFVRTSCSAAKTETDTGSFSTRQPNCIALASDFINDVHRGASTHHALDNSWSGVSDVRIAADLVSRDLRFANSSVPGERDEEAFDRRTANAAAMAFRQVSLTGETKQFDENSTSSSSVEFGVGCNSVVFNRPDDGENNLITLQPTGFSDGLVVEREDTEAQPADYVKAIGWPSQVGSVDSLQEPVTLRARDENTRATSEPSDETHRDVDSEHEPLMARLMKAERDRAALVYKLTSFVKSYAELQESLEQAQTNINELRDQIEVSNAQKAAAERALAEMNKAHKHCQEEIRLLQDRFSTKTALASSDGLPKGVQEELRQAVHLLLAQQDDMEKMRAVIERQSLVIDRLIQKRMVAEKQQKPVSAAAAAAAAPVQKSALTATDHPSKTKTIPVSDNVARPAAVVAAGHRDAAPVAAAATRSPRMSQRNVAQPTDVGLFSRTSNGGAADSVVDYRVSRPPQPGALDCFNIVQRPNFVPTLIAPEKRPSGSFSGPARDISSQVMRHPPTNSCPICDMPIPIEDSSPDAFSRHVDECLTRIAREGPPLARPMTSVAAAVAAAAEDRQCPVCLMTVPKLQFTDSEFQQHVNEHFADEELTFEVLSKQ